MTSSPLTNKGALPLNSQVERVVFLLLFFFFFACLSVFQYLPLYFWKSIISFLLALVSVLFTMLFNALSGYLSKSVSEPSFKLMSLCRSSREDEGHDKGSTSFERKD